MPRTGAAVNKPATLDESCTALMRDGSKSFFAASRVLPQRVRGPATALYAFCRVADDAIDLSANPQAAVVQLHERLEQLYAGRPQGFDADRALAKVVARFAIPQTLLDALIEGFAWDASGRRYATLEELHAYAARVAGTVGAMMALIMGTRSPSALARACELGVAMQLTNIARDVGEDARNGRLYLPLSWLQEAGIDAEDWLARPEFTAPIAAVTQRLLEEAERLYRRAEHGIAALPRDCRPAIQAARLVYAEIGHELERTGLDSVNQRTVVSTERKLALLTRALTAAVRAPAPFEAHLPALPAVAFLVDAALQGAVAAPTLPRGNFYQRTLRMLELFERQEQRRRAARSAPAQAGGSAGQAFKEHAAS
jgi:15-cis-phytoene synthase